MKTNFIPQFFRGLDPVSGVVGGLQTLAGLGQSIFSGGRKAEKKFNKLLDNAPEYTENQSILDYYNQALSRYNVSPTDSAMYKRQMSNINRGIATGINSFQDRRSGQAGVSSLLRGANDASLDAEVAAENEKSRRFGELGGATTMKADEEYKGFYNNVLMPWELKTGAASQKMAGAAQRQNAGMSNIFGGLQTAAGGYTPKTKK